MIRKTRRRLRQALKVACLFRNYGRYGILGIETDVLYQWRNLVPTYEVRLTPIRNIHVENVEAGSVKFITRIEGKVELPVENVTLMNVKVVEVRDAEAYANRNIKNFEF